MIHAGVVKDIRFIGFVNGKETLMVGKAIMENAKRSVYVSAYTYSSEGIHDELISCSRRRLKVILFIDYEQMIIKEGVLKLLKQLVNEKADVRLTCCQDKKKTKNYASNHAKWIRTTSWYPVHSTGRIGVNRSMKRGR